MPFSKLSALIILPSRTFSFFYQYTSFLSCIIIHVVSKDIPLCLQKNAFPSATKDTGQLGSLFNHLLPWDILLVCVLVREGCRYTGAVRDLQKQGLSGTAAFLLATSLLCLLQQCLLGTSEAHQVLITKWPECPCFNYIMTIYALHNQSLPASFTASPSLHPPAQFRSQSQDTPGQAGHG